MSTAEKYAEAIFRRARVPLEPAGFEPNWADAPWRHKIYPGVTRLPLPDGADQPEASAAFTLPSLAAMLRHSYGLLGRRLRVNGNPDNNDRPWYRTATWSRGTANGGGLYPAEIYWACGPSGPLLPGVYHYSTPHHAMERLMAADVTSQMRAALAGHPAAADTDQFLLVTIKLWKNSFKYNSFCYHVVTMDLGALLGTWQAWAAAMGVPMRHALWFDEPALDEMLGIDIEAESVLAVVPMPWHTSACAAGPVAAAQAGTRPVPRVVRRETERSRATLRFPMVQEVHQATIEAPMRAPELRSADLVADPRVPAGDGNGAISLPAPEKSAMPLGDQLRARHSSFGTFTARPAISLEVLSSLLAAAGAGRLLDTDARAADAGPPLCRLAVFANHVTGLPPGAYLHDAEAHTLLDVPGDPPAPFLQWQYFLNNYNLEQAAAVIVVLVRPAPVIAAIGDRGYRLVNAEVGAVAEAVYLAAAAAGTGCGAALGFDNVSLRERLGLTETDEWPTLLIMVGNQRENEADFEASLAAVPTAAAREDRMPR